jgi:hypothetical protein
MYQVWLPRPNAKYRRCQQWKWNWATVLRDVWMRTYECCMKCINQRFPNFYTLDSPFKILF